MPGLWGDAQTPPVHQLRKDTPAYSCALPFTKGGDHALDRSHIARQVPQRQLSTGQKEPKIVLRDVWKTHLPAALPCLSEWTKPQDTGTRAASVLFRGIPRRWSLTARSTHWEGTGSTLTLPRLASVHPTPGCVSLGQLPAKPPGLFFPQPVPHCLLKPPVTNADLHRQSPTGPGTMAPNLHALKPLGTHFPEISNWMPFFCPVQQISKCSAMWPLNY